MKVKSLTAILLIASLLLGIAGCKHDNKPREINYVIGENDPWYLATEFNPGEMLKLESDFEHKPICTVVDDNILVINSGYDDESEDDLVELALYRTSGMFVCENEISEYIDLRRNRYLNSYYEGDCLKNYFLHGDQMLIVLEWNTVSNEIIESHEWLEYEEFDLYDLLHNTCDSFQFGDYSVVESVIYDHDGDDHERRVVVFEKNRIIGTFEAAYNDSWVDIHSVRVEDGKFLCDGSLTDDPFYDDSFYYNAYKVKNQVNTVRLTFDIEKNVFEGFSTIESVDYNGSATGPDGAIYTVREDGIYAGDEQYVSYYDCDFNPSNFNDSKVLSVSEDRLVICGFGYDYVNYKSKLRIVKFEKMPQNPNAGKMVIKAASFDSLDNGIIEAILDYDRGDNPYYIKCDIYSRAVSSSDSQGKYYEEFMNYINSDAGPDIVFNSHCLKNLMDDDSFIDLKRELDLNADEYFTNIIDMCEVDGKQYYLPLTYSIKGIMTNKNNLDEGQIGFTFEQYEEFVSEKCDNYDPLNWGCTKDTCLINCFESMSSGWYKDGRYDLDSEAFRRLLNFIRFSDLSSGSGPAYVYRDISTVSYDPPCGETGYINIGSFVFYDSYYYQYDDPIPCGLPSASGLGAEACLGSSVSICSKTGVKDPCLEFIATLLEPENLMCSDLMTISKVALSIKNSKNYVNEYYDHLDDLHSFNELAVLDPYYECNEKREGKLFALPEQVATVSYSDPLICLVVLEESHYYFNDEKNLDSVVTSINERLNEVFAKEG